MKPAPLLSGRSRDLLRGLVATHLKQEGSRLTDIYSAIVTKCQKHKGHVWTGKYLKQLYTIAHRYAMGQSTSQISFIKSDKEGLPKDLKPFRKFLRGTPGEIQSVLTILCQYRLYHGSPDQTVSSIVEGGTVSETWKELRDKWLEFLPLFKGRNPAPTLGSARPLLRGSSGPNGPSMTTILQDAYALTQDPNVLANVREYSKFVKDSKTFKHIERYARNAQGVDKTKPPVHSRIAFLPEGGLKTRVVAIGDYFTQELLKPLHDSLMGCLKSIKSDGTYSHDKIGELAKETTRKGRLSFCYDLSSATDRFPVKLITELLSVYFGEDHGKAWENLMIQRDFHLPGNKTIRYGRGQPMGFYSSWPAFALTHHAIVQFCGYLEGYNNFQDYSLIGDDIAIHNVKVAGKYKEIIESLEVPISFDKSIVPVGNNESPSCEIAKRLFLKGEEISPIPPDIISSSGKNVLILPQMVKIMNQRGFFEKLISKDQLWSESREAFIEPYPIKVREKVVALLSNPLIGANAPNVNWGNGDHPWIKYDSELILSVHKDVLRERLDRKVAKLMGQLKKFWFDHQYSEISPLFVWAGLPVSLASTTPADDHPMLLAMGDLITELENYSNVFDYKWDNLQDYNEFLDKISYIPDLKMRAFRSKSKKREYVRASTALEVLRRLRAMPTCEPHPCIRETVLEEPVPSCSDRC